MKKTSEKATVSKKTKTAVKAPAKVKKTVPQLVVHTCDNGHAIPMLAGSLQVSFVLKDGAGKAIGYFRTKDLCPACMIDTLNKFAATKPSQPATDSASTDSASGEA